MKVILTEAAYADLYHIGKTIKQDSPRRAGTFVAELYDKCHRLGDMPLAFPLVPIGKTPASGGGSTANT